MSKLPNFKSRIVASVLSGSLLLSCLLPDGLGGLPSARAAEQASGTNSSPAADASTSGTVSPSATQAPDSLNASNPPSASGSSSSSTAGSIVTSSSASAPSSPAASPNAAVNTPASPVGTAPVSSAVAVSTPAAAITPTKVSCEAGTVQEFKLPNGLKVIMLEDHSFPVFSCMAFYRVGSRNENLGMTGVSHLVEHLLFQKVGKFRHGEIGANIARSGGMFNGFTSDDFTVFFETMAPSKLELALQVESERMKAGNFSTDAVQAEIKRIGQELDQEAKDPGNLLVKEVRSNAFQLHPYKNPTIGWRPDVEKLTADDVRRHYKEYFQPSNATLLLVGDFNSSTAIGSVKKYFAGIASGEPPRPLRVVEPPQRAERRVLMKYAGASDVVSLAYHAPAFADNDTAAMAILEKILLSGVGGRLKSKLVEGKVCSGVRCSFEVKHDPGIFTVNLTGCAGVPSQKIIEAFDSLMDQLKANPVSDTELRRARNHAEFYFQTERDGPYHTAFQLGYFDSLDSWQSAFSAYSRLRAVNAADIQRVAKRYFSPENRVLGVLAGQATKAAAAKKEAESAAKDKDKDKDKGKDKDKDKEKEKDKGNASAKSKEKSKGQGKNSEKDGDKDKSSKSKSKGKDKEKSSDSKKKGKETRIRHKTASLNSSFGLNICAYKDSDISIVRPVNYRPALLAQKAGDTKAGATAGAQPSTIRVQQATLRNGLTIGVLETKLSPMVQIMGAVKAGEAYEPVGKRSASTVLAEVMNQGSTRYSRAQAIALQDDLGLPPQSMARFEAGPQWINFQARCFGRDTGAVLGVLTQALKDPALKDEDFDHARKLCTDRAKRSPDTVKAKVDRALLRGLIAPNTSFYPLDPNDKEKFLSVLKAADVRDFQTQAIKPDATTIVFVGDISLAQAADLCEHACEGWSGKSTAKKALVQPNPRRLLKSSIVIDKREDTMVTIGRLVDAGMGTPDYPLLLLADCALTNHPIISRFAQKISGEISLSSSLSLEDLASDVESLPGTTLWTVDVPVVSNLMPVAVKSIQTELKRFAKNGMTPQEFAEVRMYLNGALPVRWLSSSPLAARTSLESLVLDRQADPLPQLLTGIGLANTETVNRFIKVTFKPDRSSLVMAGTKQAITQVHGIKQDEMGAEGSTAPTNAGGQNSSIPSSTKNSTPAPASTGGATPVLKKTAPAAH